MGDELAPMRWLARQGRDHGRLGADLRHGLVAGAVGTLGLSVFETVERRLDQGTVPVYAAGPVGRRLWARILPSAGPPPPRVGLAIRWIYGPSLGLLFGIARRFFARGVLAGGLELGSAILAVELLAMPLAGATPPVRRWPNRQAILLSAHTAVFGVASSVAFAALDRRER